MGNQFKNNNPDVGEFTGHWNSHGGTSYAQFDRPMNGDFLNDILNDECDLANAMKRQIYLTSEKHSSKEEYLIKKKEYKIIKKSSKNQKKNLIEKFKKICTNFISASTVGPTE